MIHAATKTPNPTGTAESALFKIPETRKAMDIKERFVMNTNIATRNKLLFTNKGIFRKEAVMTTTAVCKAETSTSESSQEDQKAESLRPMFRSAWSTPVSFSET